MLITMLDRQMGFRSWDGAFLDHEEERRWKNGKRNIERKLNELKAPYNYSDLGEWMLAPRTKKKQEITSWMQENGKK